MELTVSIGLWNEDKEQFDFHEKEKHQIDTFSIMPGIGGGNTSTWYSQRELHGIVRMDKTVADRNMVSMNKGIIKLYGVLAGEGKKGILWEINTGMKQ